MRKALLACGVASSLVYLSADVIGAFQWAGYSYTGQTISELAARDAPSYATVAPLFALYNALIVAFAIGVMETDARRIRWAGVSLAGIGVIGIVAAFFPIQTRGHEWTVNETMHVILTAMTVVLILASMMLGAGADGRVFRIGTGIAAAVVAGCGALAGVMGKDLAEHPVTPLIGVIERLSVFTYLAWVAWLAVVLARRRVKHSVHGPVMAS